MKKKKQSSILDSMFAAMPNTQQKSSNSLTVKDQEYKAAEVIGGKRHAFSGSKMGLKSDCSSKEYQLEAKQTEGDSISLKASWLKKISEEAAGKGKIPLMHIRFLNAHIGVEKDWFLVPGREFEKLMDKE